MSPAPSSRPDYPRAITRLREIGDLSVSVGVDVEACLEEILDAAIECTGAVKGNIQALDAQRKVLRIVAQRGFARPFLDFFSAVDTDEASVCGAAMRRRERVMVADVRRDKACTDQRALEALLAEGVHAVQSTPLVSASGAVVGMISTHFDHAHSPSEGELELVDLLARQAADLLERRAQAQALRERDARVRRQLAELNALYTAAHVGLGFVDTHLRFVRVNDRLAAINGISAEEHVGRTLREVLPELGPRLEPIYRRVMETREPVLEIELRGPVPGWPGVDKEWLASYVPLVVDGEVLGVNAVVQDISARKQSEEALRQSEARYRTLFTSISEGFVLKEAVLDAAGRIVDFRFLEVNPAFATQSGLTDVVGKTMRQVIPDIEARWIEHYADVVRTGQPLRCQERVAALGRWFEVFAARLEDAGRLRVAILFSDITARKQAEEALRESEARFRTLVEQVRDYAIFRIDPDGRPTSWNQGVQRMLGIAEAEFLGADIKALIFTPEAIASGVPEQELRTAEHRGSASNDRWMQRRTGDRFWASGMTTSLWSEGRLTGFSVVMRDMTEAKRNELLLAEHKQLLELIASNATLDACLDALTDSVPRLQSGVRAAVLVANREHRAVGDGMAVHLPASFAEAIRIAPIDQCALVTAVHAGQPVTCTDMARSDLWPQPWKALCATHGIKACHAQPILAADAKAVAAFFLCLDEARAPDDWERRIAEFGAHIAGIAIERDRTQMALRSALRELRQTLDTAATGLTRCSRDLRYVAANRAYAEMLGLSLDQVVGRPIVDVMGADAFEVIRPRVERVLRGERVEYETELPVAAVGQRCLHVVYTPWTERGGEVDGWVASVLDITARKQAEQALLEQRRLYQSVTDNASVALFITDAAHRCTFMNPAAERLTQYAFADLRERPLHDLIHHARPNGIPYPPSECPICQAFALNARQQGEEVFVRRDGRFYDVAFTASPLRGDSGHPIGTVIELRDITEHKRAERKIAEEGDRSRALISVLTDLPLTADAQGRFVAPQPAWEAYTGQTWEESKDFGWAQALHQDDREGVQALWRRACETHERYFAKGRLWHAPSGEYRYCEARATPVIDEKGELREWIGACTDVHERRLAEEALREADRRKDEFLAILAHELRNPLAPMRMAAEVVRRGTDEKSVAIAREVIERQVAAMARLIDDLMDVSRITRGRIELKKEHMTLDTAVRSAVEVTRPLMQSANQQLSLALPAAPIRVYADPARLTQVFANLLNNAAKYSEPNGRIELEAREEAGAAVVTIRDHGLGIDPAMLGSIWDMFVQAERSLEQSQGGLGIGLTLVRKLVEMHNGSVRAASAGIGCGAEFTVRLPIDHAWQPDAASAAGEHLPRPLTARVLVADDNVDAVKSLRLYLEMCGCQVETANDGRAALDLATRIRPDVALLDLGMPGLTGLDVARGIRRQPWGRDTTLVAITGWGQEQDRKRSREAGFDYHLTKPVAPTVLADVLAKRGIGVQPGGQG